MFRFVKIFVTLLLLFLGSSVVFSDIRLPAIIGNNMVLQQGKPIQIWGWSSPGEQVTVEFAGKKNQTTAQDNGRWHISLEPLEAGGPYSMRLIGQNSIELKNILVGEVWLCSGQSNMFWRLRSVKNNVSEIVLANYPQIRLFHVPRRVAKEPQDDVSAEWKECTSRTAIDFSAIAYFFGRKLHTELDVPLGLIHTSWGGTRIEPWTPPEGFRAVPELQPLMAEYDSTQKVQAQNARQWLTDMEDWLPKARQSLTDTGVLPDFPVLDNAGLSDRQKPSWLYNGQVHPLVPFTIRGAIWYQGESNRSDGYVYFDKMKALIHGWREIWKQGAFPFYFVQLAPYSYTFSHTSSSDNRITDDSSLQLARIREAQRKALMIPHTGMVVTTDIGNLYDIHPANKQEVGRRLALVALGQTYQKDVVYSGPIYRGLRKAGKRVFIEFDQIGSGLASRDGKPLDWFEIAGSDEKFVRAQALIRGDQVEVWHTDISDPVAVRFGWHEAAEPNLINREGLPASPFNTLTDSLYDFQL